LGDLSTAHIFVEMSHASDKHIVIVGAGVGGLASAMRLAHHGARVTVLDQLSSPGGKMRTVASQAGPVDAGPTVLTMKHVFEELFTETGAALENYASLKPEAILARHFWEDGTILDLVSDHDQSYKNVETAFGANSAAEYLQFTNDSRALFDAFEAPVMTASAPTFRDILQTIFNSPSVLRKMAPHSSLARHLPSHFSDPRLAQLFGRYATYVGGSPYASPALLSLIASAEAQGVWYVEGGMHNLAQAMTKRAIELGAVFHFGAHVDRVEFQNGKPAAVHTQSDRYPADVVLFNGDPKALNEGLLGPTLTKAVPSKFTSPRSLSAAVYSFAAQPEGPELAGHNVFFANDPRTEFEPIAQGQMPSQATLYVCAQDRFGGTIPKSAERFEIIMNAPHIANATHPTDEGYDICQTLILSRLQDFGLRFNPPPAIQSLTIPQDFAKMFPASNGSLYGRSPHGMTAAFQRPTVRSKKTGVYLVGGGVHPGAGIPMVTLCAKHAAAAIISDLTSI